MTKAQYRMFNRLRKKQSNHDDAMVVDASFRTITIYLRFPGLYLTYDPVGTLLQSETEAERRKSGGRLASEGPVEIEVDEIPKGLPVEVDDDGDVPF